MPTQMPIHHEVHAGRGPFMLFVHGFLSSRAQWRPNLAPLALHVRPVVVELLGHGRSGAPVEPEAYSVQSYISAFEAVRVSLGAERWLLCGQSFGAGLATQYAIAYPERVLGLVVTNSISAFSPPGDPVRTAAQRERLDAITQRGREGLESLPFHPRHAKRFDPAVRAELLDDAARVSLEGIMRSMRHTAPQLSVANRLGEVRVPMLLVNGTWEKRFQPMREKAARDCPQLRIVDLPGGHSVNLEAADGFNAAVAEFVSALLGR
jgi:pimeloyl-ACP methyl ester carboxylesterase